MCDCPELAKKVLAANFSRAVDNVLPNATTLLAIKVAPTHLLLIFIYRCTYLTGHMARVAGEAVGGHPPTQDANAATQANHA